MFGLNLPLNAKIGDDSEIIRRLLLRLFYFKINLCILTKNNNNKLLYYM